MHEQGRRSGRCVLRWWLSLVRRGRVVENLAREGITIGAVAGTSMGSLVAALVGAGLSPQRVAELLVELDHRVVETGTLKNLRLRVINMVTSNGIVESEKMQELARGVPPCVSPDC